MSHSRLQSIAGLHDPPVERPGPSRADLFRRALEVMILVDGDGQVVDANPRALAALEHTEAGELSVDGILEPDFRRSVRLLLDRGSVGESIASRATELVDSRGVRVPVRMSAVLEVHDARRYVWLVGVLQGPNDLIAERLELALTVFNNSNEGILVTDADARILAVNRAFTAITGYEEAEVIGRKPSMLQSGRQDAGFYADMWHVLTQTSMWQGEIWNRRQSGEVYPEWLNISAVHDPFGRVVNYIGLFSDISTIKASQERLDHLAHHDPLTDLPNRLLFGARLQQALNRLKRERSQAAVLFVDLDAFKPINDRYGHAAGDAVLVEVARRLSRCTREQDTVARLGGDEFAIVLEDVTGRQGAGRVVGSITTALGVRFEWNGVEIPIRASIGLAIAPQDGDDSRSLINTADTRMYDVKKKGAQTGAHDERQAGGGKEV